MEPHAELLLAIVNMQKQMLCHITFHHMHRHQDTGYAMVLGWEATLNVAMDLQAKEKIVEDAELLHYRIPFEG